MTTDNPHFLIYHGADTYHDFGKPSDERCSLTNVVTNMLNVDDNNKIEPGNISKHCDSKCSGVSGYENKIVKIIEDGLFTEYEKTQDEFENEKTKAIGIIFDMAGGFSSDNFKDPENQTGLFNINTIANIWDMAPKPTKNMIRCKLVVPDTEKGNVDLVQEEEIVDLVHIQNPTKPDPKTNIAFCINKKDGTEYIRIGNQYFNENELSSGVFNLSVQVLCGTLKLISETDETNLENTFQKEVAQNWLKFGKLNTQKPGVVHGNLINRFTKAFLKCYGTWSKQNICNFIFDLKRSMDAGQVEMVRYLSNPANKNKYSLHMVPKKKGGPLGQQLGLEINEFKIMSGDILCYTRSRLRNLAKNNTYASAVRPRINPLRYAFHESLDEAGLKQLIIKKKEQIVQKHTEIQSLINNRPETTDYTIDMETLFPCIFTSIHNTFPDIVHNHLVMLKKTFESFSTHLIQAYKYIQNNIPKLPDTLPDLPSLQNINDTKQLNDILQEKQNQLNRYQSIYQVLRENKETTPTPFQRNKFRFLDHEFKTQMTEVFKEPSFPDICITPELWNIGKAFGVSLENIHQIITKSLDQICDTNTLCIKKMSNLVNNVYASRRNTRIKAIVTDDRFKEIVQDFFEKIKNEILNTYEIFHRCFLNIIGGEQSGGAATQREPKRRRLCPTLSYKQLPSDTNHIKSETRKPEVDVEMTSPDDEVENIDDLYNKTSAFYIQIPYNVQYNEPYDPEFLTDVYFNHFAYNKIINSQGKEIPIPPAEELFVKLNNYVHLDPSKPISEEEILAYVNEVINYYNTQTHEIINTIQTNEQTNVEDVIQRLPEDQKNIILTFFNMYHQHIPPRPTQGGSRYYTNTNTANMLQKLTLNRIRHRLN